MPIHLSGVEGSLQSIEIARVKHHRALPHLNQFISQTKPEYFKTIHRIQIEHSVLDHTDYLALEHLIGHCCSLVEVKLNSNHIDMNHAQGLFQALCATQLTCFSFTDNWIGEKLSDEFFVFLKQQKKLTQLDFSINWLRDKGIVKLMESLEPSLEELKLSCNDFHREGLMAISEFVSKSLRLKTLDISYNQLDSDCAQLIASMINASQGITSIKANSNRFGDKGAQIIAKALKQTNKPLHLDLSDNALSELGVKQVLDFASLDGVARQIDLRFNSINREALGQIILSHQQQFPLTEVFY